MSTATWAAEATARSRSRLGSSLRLSPLVEHRELLFGDRLRLAPLAQRAADHPQDLNLRQGRLGDEDALVVETGVGGYQIETVRLQLQEVVREQAVHGIAVPEAQAD